MSLFSPWLFAPPPPPFGTNRTTPRSFLSYLGNIICIIAPYVPYRKKIRKEGGSSGGREGGKLQGMLMTDGGT
ncbi:hypothetical protein CABS01_04171 [Colletotrichum abscissum]|uniref:uncharacterized protein n=1 Tax=Colletotrichum abscissum TaxID=1671311 RepID=UPI0027D67D63|nr:uncharacterized protein CABS01_04171 [Colletotrichum abscissum]KAK1473509.1 hypothetical protein CABS01_04171 [Colletotrichum abscissum]